MVIWIVVVLVVVSRRELYALLCEIASIMCITYLLGSIFFTSFWKYETWGQGKVVVFDYQSRKSQGIVSEF